MLRHQMHVSLARGHLNMARGSRSNMSRSPGKARKYKIFNKEMVPLVGVIQNKEGEFQLDQKDLKSTNKTASTLRNRNRKIETKEEEESEQKYQESIENPLSWFGAMAPRAIGVAQGDFQKTLPILIDMANLQEKLEELNQKWEALQ